MRIALQRKGFKRDNSHHEMYWYFVGQQKTAVRTRISHGSAQYDTWLLGQVRKQLKLNNAQFDRFMDCPMGPEEYQEILIAAGHVVLQPPPEPEQKASEKKKGGKKRKRHK